MNLVFETERLELRPIEKKDASDIFNYRGDAKTNQYQGWIPKEINDVYDFLAKVASEINNNDSWFQFVIIQKYSNEIIGDVGIHFIDDKQAEIGCTLAKQQHGKGYATEALKELINFLFVELNKHRIITSIDPNNIPSIGLVERLGFRKEAHFRESLFINGAWVDDIVYALLQKEWTR